MKTLYLDIFSGISGDMFLGALIDLGVDFLRLDEELAKLALDGYHIHAEKAQQSQIQGTKFEVHLEAEHDHQDHSSSAGHHGHEPHEPGQDHPHHEHGGHVHTHSLDHAPANRDGRNFVQIKTMIQASPYSDWVRQKAIAVFERIAVAEGNIHGRPAEEVHFHEVGAVDSIVDIVGACLALEMLGKPQVLAAPVVDGTGWIQCAHGRLPVPAPATLAILGARGIAITQCEESLELVTPTGAALLAEFVDTFAPMSGLVAARIGYGLGSRLTRTRPNVLRAVLSEAAGHAMLDWETDTIAVLETNLDNLHAEILGHFIEHALAAGALDVFYTPIQMKKNRPGVSLSVLCAASKADQFTELILRETSALGVRRRLTERRKLQREFTTVKTPFGEVTVKVGKLNGQVVQTAPEYESCQMVAAKARVPLKQVYEAAQRCLVPCVETDGTGNVDEPKSPGQGTRPTTIPSHVGPVPSPGGPPVFHSTRKPVV